jgi:hypothetical protein
MRYILIALLMFSCKKETPKATFFEVSKVGRGSIVWSVDNLHTDFCCLNDGQVVTTGYLDGKKRTASTDSGEVLVVINGQRMQGKTITFK